MSRRALKNIFVTVLTVVLAAAAVWLREEEHRSQGARPRPSRSGASGAPAPSATWVELTQPSLVPNSANDGDSFLIQHTGGQHLLRLYNVDCPEKKSHALNRTRLADQGAAFGGLTEGETVQLGLRARQFTLALLEERPFRVHTVWEQVFDDRRHYAHLAIRQPDGSERWLSELLVEAGLARLHTKAAPLPDGTLRADFTHHLQAVEKSARLNGRGGWDQQATGQRSDD
jgi:endonuclease YncB( thermonuclease family)